MKTTLSLVLLLTLPLIAHASAFQEWDTMGIFLDPDGHVAGSQIPFNTPFDAYVLLIMPTEAAVSGFEFSYQGSMLWGSENLLVRLATNFPPGVIIINPPFDPLQGSYQVLIDTPLPAAETVILLSWQYMLLGQAGFEFHLGPADNPTGVADLPGYWGSGEFINTGNAETCFGTGARFNQSCPLPVESHSWGTLKGLYR